MVARLALTLTALLAGGDMSMAPASAGASPGLAAEDHAFPAGAVDATRVDTAFAPNGYAAIAWAETLAGEQSTVEVSLRAPGGSWSAAQPLGSTANSIYSVHTAVDAAGDAAVAWAESRSPSTFVASVATARAGAAFGAPQTFSEGVEPRVGVDAAGNVTLLLGIEGAGGGEFVRSAPAGGSLITVTPHTISTCPAFFDAELAVAPSGDAIAGIACEDNASFALRHAGSWGATATPFVGTFAQCPTGGGSFFDQVKVAIDAEGHPAGLALQTNRQLECPPMGGFDDSESDELRLALPAGGVMAAGPLVAKSGASFGISIAPDNINGETLGIGGGSIVAAWLQADENGLRSQPMIRTYPDNGAGSPDLAQGLGNASEYAGDAQVSVSTSGQTLLTWEASPTPGKALPYAAFRPAGGAFGEALHVAGASSESTLLTNAIDDTGDAVIGWLQVDGASHAAHARGFDATAPKLGAVSIPASALRFEGSAFAASASDVWGPVSFTWNFGDGSAMGASPTHAFAVAGTHTVSVTATDSVGNATTQSALVNVLEAPSGEPLRPGAPPVSAPVISGLTQSAVSWREGRQLAQLTRAKRRPAVGTTFSFNLSAPATALLQFEQTLGGRTVAGRCVVQTSHNRHKRACRRTVTAGTLNLVAHAGLNKVSFQGQLSRTRKLKPGRYTLLLAASSAGLRSAPKSLSFTILKG